eukprot:SAG31_NODE_2205_length_6195_cov_4.592520_3_plen_238_part_00
MLFTGNPQIAVIDKGMNLVQVESGQSNLQEFLTQPDRLRSLITELVAQPDPVLRSERNTSAAYSANDTTNASLHIANTTMNVQRCAPLFGEQTAVQRFAVDTSGPHDLQVRQSHLQSQTIASTRLQLLRSQFHPNHEVQLWIANKDTDDITILDVHTGNTTKRQDRAPYHYMEEIVSLSFDSRGYFATCQESENTYNGMQVGNWFMGPTLFHSQESDLIDQMGNACTPADLADTAKR